MEWSCKGRRAWSRSRACRAGVVRIRVWDERHLGASDGRGETKAKRAPGGSGNGTRAAGGGWRWLRRQRRWRRSSGAASAVVCGVSFGPYSDRQLAAAAKHETADGRQQQARGRPSALGGGEVSLTSHKSFRFGLRFYARRNNYAHEVLVILLYVKGPAIFAYA